MDRSATAAVAAAVRTASVVVSSSHSSALTRTMSPRINFTSRGHRGPACMSVSSSRSTASHSSVLVTRRAWATFLDAGACAKEEEEEEEEEEEAELGKEGKGRV